MAYEACFRDVTDLTKTITKDMIEKAKEMVIRHQGTYVQMLIDEFKRPEMQKFIDAIIHQESLWPYEKEMEQASILGLIKICRQSIKITNPIYQEIAEAITND